MVPSLKQFVEIHLKYLINTINHFLEESTFPDTKIPLFFI